MRDNIIFDYEISVGIRDDKVVGVHWEQVRDDLPDVHADQLPYMIESYLLQALEMIKAK